MSSRRKNASKQNLLASPLPILQKFSILAYIITVLLLGGSSKAVVEITLILQLFGAGLLSLCLFNTKTPPPQSTDIRWRWFIAALILIACVQFIPLPPSLWRHLPMRDLVAHGFTILGAPQPWLNISLAPWESLSALTALIPALAIYVALRSENAPKPREVAIVIIGIALISVMLALSQYQLGIGNFYPDTGIGNGAAFFANGNHQSNFLLVAIILSFTIHRQASGGSMASQSLILMPNTLQRVVTRHLKLIVSVAITLICIFGILLNTSLAIGGLVLPTLLICWIIWQKNGPSRRRFLLLPLGCVLLFAAIGLLGPFGNDLTNGSPIDGMSRYDYMRIGISMLRSTFPIGSGLGSFPQLYRWFESPDIASSTAANHAHNDFLEVLIETGLLGLLAILAFLLWFLPLAWKIWGKRGQSNLLLAASAIILLELLHSLVDYPLRTASLSALFAIAIAWLQPNKEPQSFGANSPDRDR